jgi:hypothetical protein
MNENIRKLLVRIALALKAKGWKAAEDIELTLKSDGKLVLNKPVKVDASVNDKEWRENVETSLHFTLASDDQITFFPEYSIFAEFFIEGATGSHDVAFKSDADVGFTEHDQLATDPDIKQKVNLKIAQTAKMMDDLVEMQIQDEFDEYANESSHDIQAYHDQKMWQEPEDND